MKYSSHFYRRPQVVRLFLASIILLNLLAGCTAGAPAPAKTPTATVAVTPSATEAPVATWDGSIDPAVWQGGSDYLIEGREDGLWVQANKVTAQAYFEAVFPPIDIREAPFASLSALSDRSANITVGLADAGGKEGWLLGNAANREMAHGANPMTHSFDFSRMDIDLSRVTAMRIAFNRGAPGCTARVRLNGILMGGKAVRSLGYAPLPDVQMTVGDAPLPVRPHALTGDDAGAAWRVEFPPQLVQSAQWRNDQLEYTLTGQPGSGTLYLTGSKAERTVRLAFDLSVAENQPPSLNGVAAQTLAVGAVAELRLTGLDDGDPHSAQDLTLSAQSQDEAVAAVDGVAFDPRNRWARLSLRGASAGNTRITLTLTDDRGAGVSQVFDVAVYPEINQPPRFDNLTTLIVAAGSQARQALTGVDGGEAGDRVTLSAQSDHPGLTAVVENGELVLTAAADAAGAAQVQVTATDNGGNARNQGDAAFTRSLAVTITRASITGLTDTFDGPQVSPSLAGSGEGAHTLSIEQGALRVDVDKYATNNQWAGLWYALPSELDLSANPVITLHLKADREAAMLIFLWDANDVYNTAGTVTVLAGTDWKEYTLDFSGMDLDSEGKKVDFTRIKSLLINFSPGLLYEGTFWLDDLKVGSQAGSVVAPTALEIQAPLRVTLLPGSEFNAQFPVSGLAGGEQVALEGVDPGFFSSAALALEGNNLALRLKTVPAAQGFSRLKLVVLGADDRKTEKTLDVILPPADAVTQVTVDRSQRFQTMDGFGAFFGSGIWSTPKQDLALPFVQDLGISVARFGVIDDDFEPRNDNANPYVTDLSAFNSAALPLDWMRRLKQETTIDKYILTIWSPPAWMKKNRSLASTDTAGDNFLEERYFEEYAEYLSALVRIVKEQTGIDLYAISLQNEPQFNQPYPSGLLPGDRMAQALKVVAARFAAEGIETRLFMPEALPQQKGLQEYVRQLDLVPEASRHTDIIAIHNYDTDGIHVGGAGAKDWADLYGWANAARPRQVWMTETSGHPDNWTGARLLFGNLYNALVYGNASAWVWWSLSATGGDAQFGLVVDNQPTARYAISRHFYQAARPGAVRVATVSDEEILSVAFENPDGTLAVVLYNTGKARLVSFEGAGALTGGWVSQNGLLSLPVQSGGEHILLPADGAATLIFQPKP